MGGGGHCPFRNFSCLLAFLFLGPFPLPTFRVSYFFSGCDKKLGDVYWTRVERAAEIEPTILDEINETSGPPLPPLQ